MTLLDVATHLQGLAFFKVSIKLKRPIVSTTFKIYYETQNLKLLILKRNYQVVKYETLLFKKILCLSTDKKQIYLFNQNNFPYCYTLLPFQWKLFEAAGEKVWKTGLDEILERVFDTQLGIEVFPHQEIAQISKEMEVSRCQIRE